MGGAGVGDAAAGGELQEDEVEDAEGEDAEDQEVGLGLDEVLDAGRVVFPIGMGFGVGA